MRPDDRKDFFKTAVVTSEEAVSGFDQHLNRLEEFAAGYLPTEMTPTHFDRLQPGV